MTVGNVGSRQELERLDRDALVAKAEAAGVARARVLTRPELVDELLIRSATDHAAKQRSRGLFGRARDLVARVVERGLHLPDAAERIRALDFAPPPRPTPPVALPTVTLAQIYAAQGHRDRAIDTLKKVLAGEPEHAVADSLLTRLRDGAYPVPPPVMPPEEEVVAAPPATESLDEPERAAPSSRPSPAPEGPGVDECRAVLVDATTMRVSWSVRPETLEHARVARPGAKIALCILVVEPTWDGPRSTARCQEVSSSQGDFVARDLSGGCIVRAAVGCLEGEAFASFAHSAACETPAAPVAGRAFGEVNAARALGG